MSEVIVVQSQPAQPAERQKSTLETILQLFIQVTIIGLLIAALIAAYLVIDNWEWIVTFFTTGFIGWLNPFDDPEGDKSPGEGIGSALVTAPLGGGWRIITAPFRLFF